MNEVNMKTTVGSKISWNFSDYEFVIIKNKNFIGVSTVEIWTGDYNKSKVRSFSFEEFVQIDSSFIALWFSDQNSKKFIVAYLDIISEIEKINRSLKWNGLDPSASSYMWLMDS